MKKLLLLLGFHSTNEVEAPTPRSEVVERPFDAKDYALWCKQFNVSRMSNRNGQFTVRIGETEKVVELDSNLNIS